MPASSSNAHRLLVLRGRGHYLHGPDVEAIQRAANHRNVARGRPRRVTKVDGVAGPHTFESIASAAWVEGLKGADVKQIRRGYLTVRAQQVLRHPGRRNRWQKARDLVRAKRRRLAAAARAKANRPTVNHPLFGVDYAWNDPSPAQLQAAGAKFAAQYISHDAGKDATRDEVVALGKAGINTVLVFESTSGRATQGYAAGVADGQYAADRARALGAPHGALIYFAVDTDVTNSGTMAAVLSYLAGARKGVGAGFRAGPYGEYDVVKAALDHGADGAWQTYAWSHGLWEPRAALRQWRNGQVLAGHSVDYDYAVHGDYGGWRP